MLHLEECEQPRHFACYVHTTAAREIDSPYTALRYLTYASASFPSFLNYKCLQPIHLVAWQYWRAPPYPKLCHGQTWRLHSAAHQHREEDNTAANKRR